MGFFVRCRGNMSWWSRRTACGHTPAGDSSGTPKYALWDQPSNPLTHCDSLPFCRFLASSSYTHSTGLKNIPSAMKEQHNTVLFSLLHVITRWKSTDTHRDRALSLKHLMLHVCAGEGGKGLWKGTAWGRSRLGTFPGLLNGI